MRRFRSPTAATKCNRWRSAPPPRRTSTRTSDADERGRHDFRNLHAHLYRRQRNDLHNRPHPVQRRHRTPIATWSSRLTADISDSRHDADDYRHQPADRRLLRDSGRRRAHQGHGHQEPRRHDQLHLREGLRRHHRRDASRQGDAVTIVSNDTLIQEALRKVGVDQQPGGTEDGHRRGHRLATLQDRLQRQQPGDEPRRQASWRSATSPGTPASCRRRK